MCQVTLHQNVNCKCRWGEISLPCGPGMGFSTCGQIGSGVARPGPMTQKSAYRLCPEHGLHGVYDRNCIRMVVGTRRGLKWGTGPNRQDSGCEFRCVVM
ncbi:hypothetical protein SODALDRAFT_146123 [Sodiomyces alkalinus F11]|uniref:Uncharacterized protein n=1 Tax=Sodiomyces alkalinus (strain CBS 110278 / VKM F-3762 / F11) TaxID=1314773 RepID=A0A3N2Q022_SODAK|nr:hypothetical protein SODALDRAFT_146123 [Sodiomyces alkalinus F11]ROT40114.1 hypothetical protein SODALDRAFT_146123 [Sodiomyces alkalinus F11]